VKIQVEQKMFKEIEVKLPLFMKKDNFICQDYAKFDGQKVVLFTNWTDGTSNHTNCSKSVSDLLNDGFAQCSEKDFELGKQIFIKHITNL